ncbi:MAG TPA: hypothetical protein VGB53_10910 [Rubricoccaceae bacterium]|jgi:hypothetical protein
MRLAPLALAAIAVLTTASGPARAQTPTRAAEATSDSVYVGTATRLTPGHPDLATPAVQSFDYEIRMAGPTPRVIGQVSQEETLAGDRLTIVTHLTVRPQNMDRRDTTVVAWPSLAPLSRSVHNGQEHVRATVVGGRIAGRSVLGNLDEAIDAPVPEGAFSEGVGIRVARSVPLRAGYMATFTRIDERGDPSTATVTVTGPGPDAGTWLVEVAAAGEPAQTHTVDAETRRVLRSTFAPQPNMTVEMAPPAAAPTGAVLRPGDAALSTAWMTDETATYVLNLVEPMQMPVGTSTVTQTVEGDVVTSVQTISVPSQGMNETQTVRARRATLAPVSQTMTGQQEVSLTFADGAVSGTKEGAPVSVALSAPVFDSSWSAEIARSLPLAEGYTATAAVYDATNGLSTVTFTVTGQEDVAGAPAWTVESVSPSGPATYAIDVATRRLVSFRFSPQPGVVVEMVRQP